VRRLLAPPVVDEIERHLLRRPTRAEGAWPYANSDEDAITVELLSSLRMPRWRRVYTKAGVWRWRVTYKHLGGRARLEKHIGADGLIQIEVVFSERARRVSKGLLFQAKKRGATRWPELRTQIRKMERLAPGDTAVFEYGPRGYLAADAREVLRIETLPSQGGLDSMEPVGPYLADRFLACKVGLRGLYFDAVREILVFPRLSRSVTEVRAHLKHRLKIEVEAPR